MKNQWVSSSSFYKTFLTLCNVFPLIAPSFLNPIASRPFVECNFQGTCQPTSLLYDSGSQISLLNRKIFRKIPISLRPKKLPVKINAKGASGGTLKIDGCYLLTLKILGRTIQHVFFVSSNLKGGSPGLLGIDFIKQHHLSLDTVTNKPCFMSNPQQSTAILAKEVYLPARSATLASINVENPGQQALAINVNGCPQIYKNEVLINADSSKKVCVYLNNVSATAQRLPRGTPVGDLIAVDEEDIVPWHKDEKFSVKQTTPMISPDERNKMKRVKPVLTAERKAKIVQQAKLDHLSPEDKVRYLDLLLEFQHCISLDEFEVGRCTVGRHAIPLKDESTPIFQKQFPLSVQQKAEILRQVTEWLKLGLVSKVESEFNSSLFLVKKKVPEGHPPKYRIVQDFRRLNMACKPSNFRLARIEECLDNLALKKSKVFSSIDLRHGYYNIEISPADRHKTAFWVDSLGQLAWNVSAQGLVNLPASFSRIMRRIFHKQIEKNDIEIYLDDILAHSADTSSMLAILRETFQNMSDSGLMMNLPKCKFGTKSLVYLGFLISGDGYSVDPANVKAVVDSKVPSSLKGVRSYVGLLNFYRHTIKGFNTLVKPLTALTSNKSHWSGGKLPPAALAAYEKSKEIMSSKPFISHPNFDLKMHIFSDGSLGTLGADDGGVSGSLNQYPNDDPTQPPMCLGFFSRSLKPHEKSYSAFLLENLALSDTIDYFKRYLEGVSFTCHVDHKPMCGPLKSTQQRTLQRLKEQMAQYTFDINYVKGSANPTDHYSRHPPNTTSKIENITCSTVKSSQAQTKNLVKDSVCAQMLHEKKIPGEVMLLHSDIAAKTNSSSCTGPTRFATAAAIGTRTSSTCNSLNDFETDAIAAGQNSSTCNVSTSSTAAAIVNATKPESTNSQGEQGPWMVRLDLVKQFQKTDPLICHLRNFIETKKLPKTKPHQKLVRTYGPSCFLHNDLVFITLERPGHLKKDLLFAPGQIQASLVAEAHSSKLFGHDKAMKSIERLLSNWFWIGLQSDVIDFCKECEICRRNAKKSKESSTYLKPLEVATEPFQIAATDLFGPLVAEDGTKKFILTIVDTFSKHCEFCVLPNKTAAQVASAIYSRFICRFGVPLVVTSDQGLEYRNKLFEGLCALLEIDHRFASVQNPASNSAAEVINKKIASYLKAMLDKNPKQWEKLVPSLQFSYNSAVSRATQLSPFNILYGLDPRSPLNSVTFEAKPFYGEDYQTELIKRLQTARKLATENNLKYRMAYKKYFDEKVNPESFKEGDLCYLHSPEMLKINKKLQSPFLGPYVILSRVTDHNVVIQNLETKRSKFVHLNRLRRAEPTSDSTYLGQNASQSQVASDASLAFKTQQSKSDARIKNSASATQQNLQHTQGQTDFFDFDIPNEVTWFGTGPLPTPKTIKTEPSHDVETFNRDKPEGSEPNHTGSPSAQKVTQIKEFPGPAKIGKEIVEMFGGRTTRSVAKENKIILPETTAPPAIAIEKTKVLENRAKKSLAKFSKS